MRKIKYSNLLLLGVFIYISFHLVISLISKNIEVATLENEKFEAKIKTKGLIIREEHIVKSNSKGSLDLLVEEGERIKKSQEVAKVYRNNISSNIDNDIEALNTEIDKLKNGESNISKSEIIKLNKDIDNISNKVQSGLLYNSYSVVSENKDNLNSLIDERNRLLNNDIDSKRLETKEKQKEILNKNLEKNVSNLSSEISGIVSFKFDGNEDKYSYDKIDNLTKDDINKAENKFTVANEKGDAVNENEPVIRVINNYSTYVALYVNDKEAKNFEQDKSIILRFNDQNTEANVFKMYKDGENNVIILKITNQNIAIYDTRVEEFDIIYKQVEGLKIAKSAIDVVDDKQGVYVVDEESQKVNFVELDGIVYENDDYVFVDYYTNNINGINSVDLYDRIILKPNSINKNMRIE
ncbi:hypothetical protein CHL78_013980 [Romboutsia weinsteinii]|uniref:HlyD family efflux transporter periplasmic adaptor subunit n=1 Tax=Romboutsia weinsteinii TaxID=2020949 RepID=A0A371J0X4_9FIRM|nr:HlyD family efflux transporter periplasmic adaptor subunit [Romboutsia weinsteinii]RDY26363.1 hypothetical protein CHL78_013980 [Romboutsia weinsteinii]